MNRPRPGLALRLAGLAALTTVAAVLALTTSQARAGETRAAAGVAAAIDPSSARGDGPQPAPASPVGPAQETAPAPPTSPAAAPEEAKGWSFSATAMGYFVPGSQNYLLPIFTADRGFLHLEARYNYEGLDTGSAWVGCNLSTGESLSLEFIPMLGGVFGDTRGVAPGFKLTLGYGKLEFYSEGEYLFDTGDSSNDYFYAWSELSFYPVESFRFGLVGQRTRAYQSDLEIQRGLLLGFSWKSLDLSAYVFNPDQDSPTVVLSATVGF